MSVTSNTVTSRVDAHTLAQELAVENTLRIVDVRTPAEFAAQHIPEALNVPLDMLRKYREQLVDVPAAEVVLVCRTGQRADAASQVLVELGLTGARVLDGGVDSWLAAGFTVIEGVQKWDLERQVRLAAGGIVLTSIVASTVAPKAKWVAGFIGAGLTFAAVTNTCGLAMLLAKLPYNQTKKDPHEDLIDLTRV